MNGAVAAAVVVLISECGGLGPPPLLIAERCMVAMAGGLFRGESILQGIESFASAVLAVTSVVSSCAFLSATNIAAGWTSSTTTACFIAVR